MRRLIPQTEELVETLREKVAQLTARCEYTQGELEGAIARELDAENNVIILTRGLDSAKQQTADLYQKCDQLDQQVMLHVASDTCSCLTRC